MIVTFMPPFTRGRMRTKPFFIVGDRAGRQIAAFRVGNRPRHMGGSLDRHLLAYAMSYGRWNWRLLERHWYKPERCCSRDLAESMRTI